MKRVYFVRHGLTQQNEEDCYQVFTDPLSETGRRQARALAERCRHLLIDIVIASSMERAYETARTIASHIGKEVEATDLFHELHRPSEVRSKKRNTPEVTAIMDRVNKAFLDGSNWHYSDEESFSELRARAERALRYLTERPEKHILVATHGTFLRMLLSSMILEDTLTPRAFMKIHFGFSTENTGITVCDHAPSRKNEWTDEPAVWKLVTWNDHAHLG